MNFDLDLSRYASGRSVTSGAVQHGRRGGILDALGLSRPAQWNWRVVLLVSVLPLFGQTVHYMKDLKPLWALSKAFPILSLPLAIPILTRQRMPLAMVWLFAFLWLMLVSSFNGMFAFNQSFLLGLTAQVKLLPMFYVFSFLGLLLVLRPTVDELLMGFATCAFLTFAVVFLLWALAPQSWYVSSYDFGDAPLLSADDRGNRIRMPMYFGLIAMFALYRRFLGRPDWRTGVLVAICMALIVGAVKTRAVVLASLATLAIVTFMAASPRRRRRSWCSACCRCPMSRAPSTPALPRASTCARSPLKRRAPSSGTARCIGCSGSVPSPR